MRKRSGLRHAGVCLATAVCLSLFFYTLSATISSIEKCPRPIVERGQFGLLF
jgi:hypothetical protein